IKDADLAALPVGERNILHMLAMRLVCAVQESHTWDETTVVLDCGGLRFTAKGKTVTDNGWKAVEQAYRATLKDKPDDAEDGDANMEKSLPELTEGQIFENIHAALKEGFTSPPKHFTEDVQYKGGIRKTPENTDATGSFVAA
ncbi:DNA topoisomerase III, partial [Christensenellaceae bacterium OttesenSCG-928-M15]|nr:DNA topoisomerase III [Christensenellaceae bacterium OttesenSCG-928-M15]